MTTFTELFITSRSNSRLYFGDDVLFEEKDLCDGRCSNSHLYFLVELFDVLRYLVFYFY